MQTKDYYLLLRKVYCEIGEGVPIKTTVAEIAGLLHCTERNVRYLLRNMKEESLIKWSPGKGRGHHSSLIFLFPLLDLLFERAAMCQTIEEVSRVFQTFDDKKEKGLLKRWMERQFGLKTTSYQDILRFPFYRTLPHLDPATVYRRTESHIINQLFDTLVRYNPQSGQIEPHLAHHWECLDNYTRWIFYLRKGVYFHHGKQMTSEDILFTLNRVQEKNSNHKMAHSIVSSYALKPFVVELRLNEPNALLLHFFTNVTFSVVPSDLDESTFSRLPIGTGSFALEKNDEKFIILNAYEHYFKERAYLDRIEIWVWSDKTWQEWLHQKNSGLFLVGHSNLEIDRPTHQLNQVEHGATYLTINSVKKGPLLDEKLRQAIHFGIDRDQMISDLKGHRLKASCSFDPLHNNKPYLTSYNLEKSRELLQKSSYRGEVIKCYTYDSDRNIEDGEWIQKQLENVGIKIDLISVPILDLMKDHIIREADMILSGEVVNEPFDISLIDMYESSNPFLITHIGEALNMKKLALLKRCMTEPNLKNRMSILYEIENLLIQNHVLLFFYHSGQTVNYELSLNGIALNALGNVEFNKIWVNYN